MLIGVMSDSHDNLTKIQKAVELFNQRGVSLVIHAGDFIAPFALNPLEGLRCDYVAVFGNNDGERLGLVKKSSGRIMRPPRTVEYNSRKILILHEPDEVNALTKSQDYDIIVYGHTHECVLEKQGMTLVLNPGECCGWLTGKSTVALVEMDTLEAEIVNI